MRTRDSLTVADFTRADVAITPEPVIRLPVTSILPMSVRCWLIADVRIGQ